MRLTVGSLKEAVDWTESLNLCVTDARWLRLLNQALPRLMNAGRYVGQVQTYRFATTRACITLPRQFAAVEVLSVCNQPSPLRNQWFEFLENGPGLAITNGGCSTSSSCCGGGAGHGLATLDRGRGYAGFGDFPFAQTRLRFFATQTADLGKYITVRGYDSNGNWVLTSNGSVEGEPIRLASPYVDSVTIFGKQQFRQVLKAVTRGFVKVYAYDVAEGETVDPTLCPIAVWEPSETLPDYRRYLIPAVESLPNGCCANASTSTRVDALVRLQHIDVSSDLDLLPVGNVQAIKMAMLAVQKEERGDWEGAKVAMFGSFDPIRRRHIGGAIPALEEELEAHQGAGSVVPIRLTSDGRPNVENII